MKTPTFDEITITPQKLRDWEEEIAQIGQQIKALIQKKEKLQGRINAISFFIDDERQIALPGMDTGNENPIDHPQPDASNGTPPLHEMPPPDAIRSVLRDTGESMTKDEIRERLKLANYPMHKFRHDGGYFHTIISRMEKAGKLAFKGGKVRLLG
jgi:hypothetical protein